MAAAYAYADGGQKSRELILLDYITRFGTEAVMGRLALGAGEIRRMIAAENIVKLYLDRSRAENWATWAFENPDGSQALNAAMMETENDQ